MSKQCAKCGENYAGFGTTCPTCRGINKSGGQQRCEQCGSYFSGFGKLCNDCGVRVSDTCRVCKKTAFACERLAIDHEVFHPWCFRCKECNTKLSTSNYTKARNGDLYCKVHHEQRLKFHGRFSFEEKETNSPVRASKPPTATASPKKVLNSEASFGMEEPMPPDEDEIILEDEAGDTAKAPPLKKETAAASPKNVLNREASFGDEEPMPPDEDEIILEAEAGDTAQAPALKKEIVAASPKKVLNRDASFGDEEPMPPDEDEIILEDEAADTAKAPPLKKDVAPVAAEEAAHSKEKPAAVEAKVSEKVSAEAGKEAKAEEKEVEEAER